MCVCDNLNWMENGWMDWIEWMWRVARSGSHTTVEGKFEWTPFTVHYNFD